MKKGVNRDCIKYFAMLAMLLNHIATIFMPEGALLTEIFLDIGYFTAITMCYFLVEGYHYTHAKKAYGIRLAVFAAISELPYCLAFTEKGVLSFVGMNMIFTLLLCFLILWTMEHVWNEWKRSGILFGLLLLSIWSDWPVLAPIFTILFAKARGDRERIKKSYLLAMLAFGVLHFANRAERYPVGTSVLMALGSVVGIALSGVTILNLYNGQRAKWGRNFSKWFFYLFYPVHLLILGLLKI